jgi:hypothetical protein
LLFSVILYFFLRCAGIVICPLLVTLVAVMCVQGNTFGW